jgi:hypothetical protein
MRRDQNHVIDVGAKRPILAWRLADAISATAGAVIGAWEQAGRPAVTLEKRSSGREREETPAVTHSNVRSHASV